MKRETDKHILKNGMTVLGEPMEEVGSAAFNFLLPCGTSRIGKELQGAGKIIKNWVMRGAGGLSGRELTDRLDGLGLHRSNAVGSYRMGFSAAMEAGSLLEAIELYSSILQNPELGSDQFELCRQLALSEFMGLDDNPRQKVMISLREKFYPEPLGLNAFGTMDTLHSLTSDETAGLIDKYFSMPDTIFSVAGSYDFDKVCSRLEELFGGAEDKNIPHFKAEKPRRGYWHEPHEGSQVHIGIMTETVPIRSDKYFDAQVAVSVLSGGMSSRLFTEVREKRGLCYAVGANYNTLKDEAGISCYAGTTPDKAEETLEVVIDEFKKLKDGVSEDELARAKAGLKSTTVMRSESSMSRASSIGGDYNLLGEVRCLSEIKRRIEAVTLDSLQEFLDSNPFEEFCVVSIGPKEIEAAKKI
ncbi:M16 family metallopeptidase [Sedimentisphaera salicampi]|uniref:M16 family metallopeptidase n=1 Tax=Sedimentisphaera salicampi TaxID=1941349 RepID=UPI000B9C4A44|nr:pitrilysin family protein [Sedimentisphaera salicampi]OXU15077.1 Peptidase M16 inactive domain protein [Sedimentisphaera salicampi]